MNKYYWTPEEDKVLVLSFIRNPHPMKAANVAAAQLKRTPKACYTRWHNILDNPEHPMYLGEEDRRNLMYGINDKEILSTTHKSFLQKIIDFFTF